MRDDCIAAVERALGRDLRPGEAQNIEARIARHMRLLARKDPPAWSALSEPERLTQAGQAAAKEFTDEAALVKKRLELRLATVAAIDGYLDRQVIERSDRTQLEALRRLLVHSYDDRNGGQMSIDSLANGSFRTGISQIVELLEDGREGLLRFVPFRERQLNRAMINALHNVGDVPPRLAKAAKAFHDFVEIMRRRYNAAGGNIGRLEDWGMPHQWSAQRLLKIGREAFVQDMTRTANRSRYVNEDGSMMTQSQLETFFSEAYNTIITDGANKRATGERPDFARGVFANRHRAHREIHIAPEHIADMLEKYSDFSALEAITHHLRRLSRDTAIIETLGPSAENTFEQLLERATAQHIVAFPKEAGAAQAKADATRKRFELLSGATPTAASQLGAAVGSFARSWQVFTNLGGAVISAIGDLQPMYHTAMINGMSPARLFVNDVAAFAGFGRRWARRAGLMTDTIIGQAERFYLDTMDVRDVGAKAASFTMHASGMNWVTEARRNAFSMTMMDTLGHLARHYPSVSALKEADRAIARRLNIDEATWAVWRLAKRETLGLNHTLLTVNGIFGISDADIAALRPGEDPQFARMQAAERLLGVVTQEQDIAIITPGLDERAAMVGRSRPGTYQGEFQRAFMLFKSFPWTLMNRHWKRAASMSGVSGRFAYMASFVVITTMLGVIANWLVDLFNGRNPRTINPLNENGRKNWLAGAMKGGGLGFYGDFLFAEPSNGFRQGPVAGAMGPVFGDVEQFYNLTWGNVLQAGVGEETNLARESIMFARSQTPNIWYSRAVLDRAIFNNLLEEIEPGALARAQMRAYRTRGTSYWWQPGEALPSEAPDLSTAFED